MAGEEAAGLIVMPEEEAQGVTDSLLGLIHSGGEKTEVFPSHCSVLHVPHFWLPSIHYWWKREKISERMVLLQAQIGNKVTDHGHPAGEGKRNRSRPCRGWEQERKVPSLLQL